MLPREAYCHLTSPDPLLSHLRDPQPQRHLGIGRHHLLDDLGFELFAVPWYSIRSLRPLEG